MKEIFEQYGGAIIAVVAVLALVGVVNGIVGSNGSGLIYKAMADLINSFSKSITV